MPPRANLAEKSEDEKLLIAVLSQWVPLPAVDHHELGAALGIKSGAAAKRWSRFKLRLFKNAVDRTAGDDIKDEDESAQVGNAAQNKTGGDCSTVGQQAAMIEQLANGKRGKGNRKRPVMKGSDEQTSTAVIEPFQDATAGDGLGVGRATAIVNKPAGSRRGRKRLAVDEGSTEPAVQRKRIKKSIATSLNAGTSKPSLGQGNKTSKDKGALEGLPESFKQEDSYFGEDMEWAQFREQGDGFDELQGLGDEV